MWAIGLPATSTSAVTRFRPSAASRQTGGLGGPLGHGGSDTLGGNALGRRRRSGPAAVAELCQDNRDDGKGEKGNLVFQAREDAGAPRGKRGRSADATCRPLIR